MKTPTLLFTVCIFAAFSPATSDSQEEMRFVLLKSGRIVEGQPFVEEEKTRIELSGGDYIVIPNNKIAKSFRRRNDVFNYKAAITPIQTNAQNALMRWVIMQKNATFATQHLNELRRHAQQLPQFDFEYWSSAISKRKSTQTTQLATTSSARSNQYFKTKVENHLVMGCALSGCHRSNSAVSYNLVSQLELDSANNLENLNRTRKILRQIGKSTYLQKVAHKHGSLRAAMYPKATKEYLEIATWVNSLKVQNPTQQLTIKNKRPPTIQSVPSIQNYKSDSRTPERSVSQASYLDLDETDAPRDEFDPLIFNRKQQEKWAAEKPASVETPKVDSAPKRLIFNEEK